MPRFLKIFLVGGGGILQLKNHKVPRKCLNFNGGGVICNFRIWTSGKSWKFGFSQRGDGGGILQLKSQSAKISDNLPFGGGGYSATEKSKCQDFWQFAFPGGGGYSATEKSKCQDFWQFFCGWVGGGVFCNFGFGLREKVGNLDFPGGGNLQLKKSQSTKIYLNMNFPFYYSLFHSCLGYYIYLLLFPIIFTLLLIFH